MERPNIKEALGKFGVNASAYAAAKFYPGVVESAIRKEQEEYENKIRSEE